MACSHRGSWEIIAPMSDFGKYSPCPCGSGKQYKWCCMESDRRARAAAAGSPNALPDGHFIAEINPKVDDAVDGLMQRLQAGDRDEGIKPRLESLLRQHPQSHTPYFGLGVYHLLVDNDPAAALPFFEQSVKIFPYFAEGHYNLAGCAMQRGDIKQAAQSFRAVLRYSEDRDVVGRAEKQLHFLESLVRKEGVFDTLDGYIANQALFDEAFEAMVQRDFKRAENGFRKVLDQNPRHVQSHGNLGLVYAGMGMKAAALASLDQALALDSGYEPARDNRRVVETMTEGKPLVCQTAETRYYAEAHAQQNQDSPPRRSIWQMLKNGAGQ
jgi:tetratricopeptide (TPR) repeat protein